MNSSEVTMAGLCLKCASVNLPERMHRTSRYHKRFWEPSRGNPLTKTVDTRPVGVWRENQSCSLCQLVLKLANEANESMISGDDTIDLVLQPVGALEQRKRKKSSEPEESILVSHINVVLTLTSAPSVPRNVGVLQVLPSKTEQQKQRSSAALCGRKVHELVDIGLLKHWITTCDNDHGRKCTKHQSGRRTSAGDFGLRVIDLTDRRVVNRPLGCKYVALSYVWGLIQQLQMTKDTYERLTTPGGLDIEHPELTRSARDAMVVCQQLGYRFLWIDALCILQDDDEDRHRQCTNMNRVYEGADITIVAATGNDSNAGLPGVVPGSRVVEQEEIRVRGSIIVRALGSLADMLSNSVWDHRAWTFQEKVLSRRLLVFTEKQAHWVCNTAVWQEDISYESQWKGLFLELWPATNRLQNDRSILDGPESQDHFGKYRRYVESYSPRGISKPDDTIQAFAGIMEELRPSLGPFSWGLPLEQFPRALLWHQTVFRPRQRLEKFPSWSWAGWSLGRDTIAASTDCTLRGPEICVHRLDSQGSVRHGPSKVSFLRGPDHKIFMDDILSHPERQKMIRFWTTAIDVEVVPQTPSCNVYDIKVASHVTQSFEAQDARPEDIPIRCSRIVIRRVPEKGKNRLEEILISTDDTGISRRVPIMLDATLEPVWKQSKKSWRLITMI